MRSNDRPIGLVAPPARKPHPCNGMTAQVHIKADDLIFVSHRPANLELTAEPDPDLGRIGPGHVCKHGVRWPHACNECDAAAFALTAEKEGEGDGE